MKLPTLKQIVLDILAVAASLVVLFFLFPFFSVDRFGLVGTFLNEKKYDSAAQAAKEIYGKTSDKSGPVAANALFLEGMSEFFEGHAQSARARFASILNFDKNYYRAHFYLGVINLECSRYADALEEFKSARNIITDSFPNSQDKKRHSQEIAVVGSYVMLSALLAGQTDVARRTAEGLQRDYPDDREIGYWSGAVLRLTANPRPPFEYDIFPEDRAKIRQPSIDNAVKESIIYFFRPQVPSAPDRRAYDTPQSLWNAWKKATSL